MSEIEEELKATAAVREAAAVQHAAESKVQAGVGCRYPQQAGGASVPIESSYRKVEAVERVGQYVGTGGGGTICIVAATSY